jgi:methyl-accepting chemotaxis protein
MKKSPSALLRRYLPWLGLYVVLLISHGSVLALGGPVTGWSSPAIAAALALGVLLLVRVASLKMFEQPLETMVSGMERARVSGDLTFKLTVRGQGALPRLAESYNRLIEEFGAAMAKMLFTSSRLQDACTGLGDGAERVAGSTETQCAASGAASADVGHMKSSMQSATDVAARTVEDAERSRELSQQGTQVVRRVADGGDPRNRRPDQPAGPQCRHRSGARRRTGPRLRGGGRRSAQAGRTHGRCPRGTDTRDDFRRCSAKPGREAARRRARQRT